MRRLTAILFLVSLTLTLSTALGACTAGETLTDVFARWNEKPEPETTPKPAEKRDPLLAETIGERTLLGSGEPIAMRGFGLVVGLGENGSSDCPTALREYLVEYLQKEFLSPEPGEPKPSVTPQELIESKDTAVVSITGLVAPGAPRGSFFDLRVEALPGTSTRSLEGGLLLPSELRLFNVSQSGQGLLAGHVLARARGPIFTNPFVGADGATSVDLRRGYVLGGGWTTEERTLKFTLIEPSYPQANRIEARLNDRFGMSPKIAEAMSMGYLLVRTPPEYADNTQRFIDLAAHVYIRNDPPYQEQKLREISEALGKPETSLEHVSLLWEGLGRTCVPRIQALYNHPDAAVRYYAARAGLNVSDATALPVVAQFAYQPNGQFRLEAVRELANCSFPQATERLLPLLEADDVEVRVAAYEGLRRRRHGSVQSTAFANLIDPTQTSVFVDVVRCGGKPMIYVRRTREPRIAIFGEATPVSLPLFYTHPKDRVTLTADAGAKAITLVYRMPYTNKLAEQVSVPPRVVDLIKALAAPVTGDSRPASLGNARAARADSRTAVRGAGLTYSQLIGVVSTLCRNGTIPAQFEAEKASITELPGAAETPRAEGDSAAPASAPAGREGVRKETDESDTPPGAVLPPKPEKKP